MHNPQNEISEREIRGGIPFDIAKRNKVPRNKPYQGDERPVLRKLQNTEERNQGKHKQMESCTMFMDWNN